MPLASKNGKNYAVLDFSQITEKGIQPLIDALNRNKVTVIQVAATNKAARRDNVLTKQAKITLQDGQELLFQVNDTGDISAVKLNGKVIPVHIGESLADVARAAGSAAAFNSTKFTDALAKKARRAVESDISKKPSVKSTAQKIQDAKKEVAEKGSAISSLNDQIKASASLKDKLNMRLQQAQTELTQEKATSSQLEQELNELEKTVNA